MLLSVQMERRNQVAAIKKVNMPLQQHQSTPCTQVKGIQIRNFAKEGASEAAAMAAMEPERDPLEAPLVTEVVDLTGDSEAIHQLRIKVTSEATVPLPKEQIQFKIPAKLMESAIRTKKPLVLNVKGGVLVFDPAKKESRFVPHDKIPTHKALNHLLKRSEPGAPRAAPTTSAPRATPHTPATPTTRPPAAPGGCDRVLVPVDRAALPPPHPASYVTVPCVTSAIPPQMQTLCSKISEKEKALIEKEKFLRQNEKSVKDEIKILKRKIAVLTKANARYMKTRKELRKNAESTAMKKKTKNMSELSKLFFECQCKNAKAEPKARRFTNEDKAFALSLHRNSPKEYRFLRSVFVLPSGVSLKRTCSTLNIKPGIYDVVLEELSMRTARMTQRERTHALAWELVPLQPHVAYDVCSDTILGLVDHGGGRRANHIADTALAFVLRGFFQKSTHPLAYYLIKEPVDPQILASIVREVTTRALAAGVRVAATVCDHRPENMAAVEALVAETHLRAHTDPELGDYWEADGHRIIPLYDAGALLVSLRDHLLTYNLFFIDDNDKRRIARWEHVRQLATANEEYEGLRMVKTLTEKHVQPHLVPPTSVPHAAQVLSATVAALLKHLSEAGKLAPESEDTALVFAFFDRLFDSFNSDVFQIYPDKDYRSAIRKNSAHHLLWAESQRRLENMKFITSDDTHSVDVSVLRAWRTNIQSFQHLTKALFAEWPDETLLARHISLDGLREMVDKMRERGCMAFSPTYVAFHGQWRRTLQDKMTERKAMTFDEYQQHLRWFLAVPSASTTRHEALDADDAELELSDAVDADSIVKLCSALLGTVTFKKRFGKCDKCKKDLLYSGSEEQFADTFVNFLARDSPSHELVQCVAFIYAIATKILPRKMSSPGILNYLRLVVDSYIDYAFVECSTHKSALVSYISSNTIHNVLNLWLKDISNVATGKTQTFNPEDPVHVAAHELSRSQLVIKKKRKRRNKNLNIPMV